VQAGTLGSAASAVTLHFTAAQLGQGIYHLGIADTITDDQGRALDGDADGIQGGSFAYQGNRANGFYELGGDFNGDGGVTIFDFPTFAYWFSRNVPIAPAYVDLNGDNGITIFDFPYFSNNFGRSLTDPTPLATGGIASQAVTIMSRSSHPPMAVRQATAQSVADRQPASQHALQAALASWDRRPADRARFDDELTWLAISRHVEALGEPDPLIGDHTLFL
jgi:hypothetical protein